MLTVFNCGQGDAFKIKSDRCYWSDVPLYVDCGPKSFKSIILENEIDLLITHNHDDHINGFDFSFVNKIRDLYIPAYFPEIRKIYKKLGFRVPKIPFPPTGKTFFVYDGFVHENCRHINFLNPPLNPLEALGLESIDEDKVNKFLNRNKLTLEEIINTEDEFNNVPRPDGYNAIKFIKAVITRIEIKKKSLPDALAIFDDYDANRISIVFSYKIKDYKLLMTGDADKYAFRRILRSKKSLKSDILKIPHHGSNKNLTLKIFSAINPEYVIFSHKNGLFGKSKDPHPNKEIINICKKNNVKMFFTNDVDKRPDPDWLKYNYKKTSVGMYINNLVEFK